MQKVGIVGAGPAGMMAAFQTVKHGAETWLIEKNSLPGRKLRITGAGRGNLTNSNAVAERYYSSNQTAVQQVLAQFGHHDLVDFLFNLGIATQSTGDGWFYPISNSAANVVALFAAHLNELGVNHIFNHDVTSIQKSSDQFEVLFESGKTILFDRVILASGGKAYPSLGSNGNLFPVIEKLGHKIETINPALAPILTERAKIHKLQGIRLNAKVSLWDKSLMIAATFGNIIFTSWGLNGPGVMDISHFVHGRGFEGLFLQIDMIHENDRILRDLLNRYRHSSLPIQIWLAAVLPPKAVHYFANSLNISDELKCNEIDDPFVNRMISSIKNFRVEVKGTKGYDQCQLSTGGVSINEIDPNTMESKIVPGLYFSGEILDVVGPCGGYNLQWAFSSGFLAGKSAAMAN